MPVPWLMDRLLFRTIRLAAALLLWAVWMAMPTSAQETAGRLVLVIDVTGAIGPATTEHVVRGLNQARERNAELLVLRMDTPGGLDTSMREIIQAILASPVPVATYVAPSGARAASAGTFILYATHLAAMAPGTNLGAATPVAIGGGGPPIGDRDDGEGDEDEEATPRDAAAAKAINDAAAFIRGLAEMRGRNADWAERAVRQGASLSASAALDQNVIELVVRDLDALLAAADGRTVTVADEERQLATAGAVVETIEPTWRIRLFAMITNPNVAYILLLVGIYGIIFEFASPGTIFSGVIGAICLLLGLYALNVLPVNFAGVGLIAFGVALMAAEAFVPSFGILGIGGIISFALGSLLLFDTGVPGFRVSWAVVGAVTAVSAGLLVFVLALAVRSHRRPVVTGEQAVRGSTGRVVNWSGQTGFVHYHGEEWQARSDRPLTPGQDVIVTGRSGLTLLVEPRPESKSPETEKTQ